MTEGRADAERLAIPQMSADLRSYVARMKHGQDLVSQRLRQAEETTQRAIDEARRRLVAATEKLESTRQEGVGLADWAVGEVNSAHRHLEAMYVVAREVAELSSKHRPVARRFSSALDTLDEQVQRELTRAGDTLDVYLGSHGGRPRSLGTAEMGALTSKTASPSPAPTLHQPAGFPADVVMVPLSHINDSDSVVHGPGDFGKGYTAADLEWAHEAFISVIMPGVAKGLSKEDFRLRDQREGRVGARSFADTYAGFFEDSKIRLEISGGHFAVSNGYHRIWVARHMGLDAVPAKVS